MIITSDYGSFPHSLLSTSKMMLKLLLFFVQQKQQNAAGCFIFFSCFFLCVSNFGRDPWSAQVNNEPSIESCYEVLRSAISYN